MLSSRSAPEIIIIKPMAKCAVSPSRGDKSAAFRAWFGASNLVSILLWLVLPRAIPIIIIVKDKEILVTDKRNKEDEAPTKFLRNSVSFMGEFNQSTHQFG